MPRVPTDPIAETQTNPASTPFQRVSVGISDAPGRALQGVGAALSAEGERLAQATARIQNRRNTVDRIKRKDALSQELFTLFNKTNTEQDVTDPEVLSTFGQQARTITQRHVNELRALGTGEDNELQFAGIAQGVVSGFRDQLAQKSVAANAALVKGAQDTAINSLASEASANPDSALLLMEGGVQQQLQELDGLMDTPSELAFVVKAQGAIAQNAIDEYLSRGDAASLGLAMEMMKNPAVTKVLSPAAVRGFGKRSSEIGTPPRILSQQETANLFRMPLDEAKNYIVEQDKTGFTVKLQPTAGQKQRAEQIEQYVGMGMDFERATDIADGNIEWSVVEKTGEVLEHNIRTRETIISKKVDPQAITPEAAPAREPGLYQQLMNTPTSGFPGAFLEFMVAVPGQVSDAVIPDVAVDAVRVRQNIATGFNDLIEALTLNPRFPVQLVKLVKEQNDIEPGVWKSDRLLLIRMVAISKSLRVRMLAEKVFSENPNNSADGREDAARAVKEINLFLDLLDVPEDADPMRPEAPPVHILNDEQFNALESGTPFIGPDGVRRTKP